MRLRCQNIPAVLDPPAREKIRREMGFLLLLKDNVFIRFRESKFIREMGEKRTFTCVLVFNGGKGKP